MGQLFQCLILLKIKKLTLNRVLKKLVAVFLWLKLGFYSVLPRLAAIALVIDVFSTHDVKLARKLYQHLNPGDVLLGDRAFC